MKSVLYAASVAALLAAAPAYAQTPGEPTPNSVVEGQGTDAEGTNTGANGTVVGEPGVAATGEMSAEKCGEPGATDPGENCVDQEDPKSGSNTEGGGQSN